MKVEVRAVSWLRWLVAGILVRRYGFNPRPVRVGFMVAKETLENVFFRLLQSFLVNIFKLVCRAHSVI